MPGSHPMRWLIFLICSGLAIAGCASDAGEGGSLALDLTIADGFEIDTVSWEITNEGMDPMSGQINTSAPGSTASVEVFGLPPGEDYLITMTAIAVDEETMCRGAAFFPIAIGEVTDVHVMLNCKRPERFGGVRVNGWFNLCAELTKVVVSPLQTSVGNDIDLSSTAVDEEGDPIAYMWMGRGGTIADPMAASTTFTCTEVGEGSVTIKVSDDDFIYCVSEWTVPVTCVPAEGDLCEGVECPDLGECKDNTCNPANGMCEESNVDNGTACGDGGMCMDGECVEGDMCEGVTCPDLGECKNNICNPADGMCEESNVDNGTACGDGAGMCMGGECVAADLCEDVTCPDLGECKANICNPADGMCEESNVADGTACVDGGMCMGGTCAQVGTTLNVEMTGPPAAFGDQEFEFSVQVTNTGVNPATNVVLVADLPDEGTFVSSDPAGSSSGDMLTIDLGDVLAGGSVVVTITWQAPANETTLVSSADASADNAAVASDSHMVAIGTQTVVTGGVTAAGTGLRNRDNGDITIVGVPDGAVVTRAVLVWALLYRVAVPGNQITFQGEMITADLTQTISTRLCWGDSATIGFAADVTALVAGNGIYSITDPINGIVREDDNPAPVFPVTDGAGLIVFYGGPGLDAQVLSDFSYSAEDVGQNVRNLAGINSTGGAATLYLVGPDGQNNFDEEVRVTGSAVLNFDDSWDGSDPQEGPDFSLGNVWDTDVHDMSSILPVGQTTLNISLGSGNDCTGLSAVVLEVEQ